MADDGFEAVRVIDDDDFMAQLWLLLRTRHFLIAEGVSPSASTRVAPDEMPFSLGRLNLIGRDLGPARLFLPRLRRKRSPTLADWKLLEERQAVLQSYFTLELQHRFRLETTRTIITIIPVILVMITFIALFLAVYPPFLHDGWVFGSYLAWSSCLGGLGAIGFLAMNSLAIQSDVTFDISSTSLVMMRIV
jgi:hypothetical protein